MPNPHPMLLGMGGKNTTSKNKKKHNKNKIMRQPPPSPHPALCHLWVYWGRRELLGLCSDQPRPAFEPAGLMRNLWRRRERPSVPGAWFSIITQDKLRALRQESFPCTSRSQASPVYGEQPFEEPKNGLTFPLGLRPCTVGKVLVTLVHGFLGVVVSPLSGDSTAGEKAVCGCVRCCVANVRAGSSPCGSMCVCLQAPSQPKLWLCLRKQMSLSLAHAINYTETLVRLSGNEQSWLIRTSVILNHQHCSSVTVLMIRQSGDRGVSGEAFYLTGY